jgi:chemotaxis protein CheC
MKLSDKQIDALTEVLNIGMGRGAGVLNTMLQSHVSLQAPHIRILALDEYLEELRGMTPDRLSAVQLGYQGTCSGKAQLLFPTASASKLVTMLTGEALDSDDFDLIQAGTLSEVGNMVINGVLGTISNLLGQHFVYSVPTYLEERADSLLCTPDRGKGYTVLLARTRFTLERYQIEGDLLLLFEVGALDELLEALGALTPHE